MPTATLMNQKVREIHFNNDLERKHGNNRQLGSSFSFQVNYSPDGERCVAKRTCLSLYYTFGSWISCRKIYFPLRISLT